MRILVFTLSLLLFGFNATYAQSNPLKRPMRFGFQPIPVTDSIAQAQGMSEATGLLIGQILPGATIDFLGARTGDVLLQVNGKEVSDWVNLRSSRDGIWDGDSMKLIVWRDGKQQTLKGIAQGKERETSDRWEVIYDAIPFDGGHLSAIVTRPKTPGPHPTVYFIPGYTCATVDNLSPIHPYRKILDSLSALNYVVYRVEKPGLGDGPNPCDCIKIGFDKELDGFKAGWEHLLNYDFVDQEKIFIFGHSMGGVEAPLLAADTDVKPLGVAVYGIIYQTWYEYIIAMLRFQNPRAGADYLAFEKDMQEYLRLFYKHYVELEPIEKILKNPTWKALLERDFALTPEMDLLGRRTWFWRELAGKDLVTAWSNLDAHVLSMYGEADFEVFNSFSMSEISEIVNRSHPGKGTYVSFPGTNHSLIEVGSMEKEVELKGSPAFRDYLINHFNWNVVTELHQWMQGVME